MRKVIIIPVLLFTLVFSALEVKADVNVSADSAILIDQSTGRVLFEKNADEKSLIASITKIMTAIVAIESGDLSDNVKISNHAIGTEGSSIYLTKDDQFTLEELIYGLMLRSGNDAAVAISEQVGGSEEGFVHLMNEKASWIGMTNTHFDNPHGLDSDTHYSTAYDMALLMSYAMENDTFAKISGTTSFKADGRDYAWANKNKLLTSLYDYCNGGKTGYTKAAGRTLVTSAEKNGHTLIAVTLNGPNDWNDHIQMYEWGFKTFAQTEIQSKGIFPFEKKAGEVIHGEINRDVYYPLREGEFEHIETKTFLTENDPSIDSHFAKKVYYLNDEKIAETSIYRVSDTEKEEDHYNFWSGMLSAISHLFGDHDG
ncbi:D-alanyl-D-alanine carboxypeptidase [Gracilibacillus ureilyticus]|uniref:D-alanyl-D-alanine carboxypeptidase n=2 Tax=Gracilibacillus ureilyticus TaxID=531814 RepID=A0A1H9LT17_9BACI|nr:D-alanyl-D-alanine carboxypeptidase family protein [Gracilibacillus ureilyticus]SER14458.1 D-alanyl-D-alanine carboxypeptidase [Gracilibacillus ureilyticus]